MSYKNHQYCSYVCYLGGSSSVRGEMGKEPEGLLVQVPAWTEVGSVDW